jgi:hypothetical protein
VLVIGPAHPAARRLKFCLFRLEGIGRAGRLLPRFRHHQRAEDLLLPCRGPDGYRYEGVPVRGNKLPADRAVAR